MSVSVWLRERLRCLRTEASCLGNHKAYCNSFFLLPQLQTYTPKLNKDVFLGRRRRRRNPSCLFLSVLEHSTYYLYTPERTCTHGTYWTASWADGLGFGSPPAARPQPLLLDCSSLIRWGPSRMSALLTAIPPTPFLITSAGYHIQRHRPSSLSHSAGFTSLQKPQGDISQHHSCHQQLNHLEVHGSACGSRASPWPPATAGEGGAACETKDTRRQTTC